MQILLPIAGLGTRIRPHTHVRPKPMLSLAGKPVLGHLLDYVLRLKPSSVIFIVGERAESIEEYVRSRYDVPVYFRTQNAPRGQSHAIAMAADVITEPLLIVFGDTLFEAPLDRLVDGTVDGVIGVSPVHDPARFGVIEERYGFITRLVEKPVHPPSNLALMGVYMLNDYNGLLRAIDEQMSGDDALQGEFFLAGALQRMIDGGARLRPLNATGWWDTGTIAAVLQAHRHLVELHRTRTMSTSVSCVVEPCHIDPTAKLERCVVGPYVTVGARAVITDCAIRDSIIGDDVDIAGLVLRGSVVGNHVTLRADPQAYNIADHSSVVAAATGEEDGATA